MQELHSPWYGMRQSAQQIWTLTMFVRVSGVTATAVVAANPTEFQLATVYLEYLPIIALTVVKHAPEATTSTV